MSLECDSCHQIKTCKQCSGCKSVVYCGRECQLKDWTDHKQLCKLVQQANQSKTFVKHIIQEATGDKVYPKSGQTVVVHYTGKLVNGKKFDSSVDRKEPFEFSIDVGQVIQGWDKGVMTMAKGEKALLICSPDYAYGSSGAGRMIPPNSTLIFEVELLDLQ